jgi:hypothetical protein
MAHQESPEGSSPQERIVLLVRRVGDVVRKARRHNKTLTGRNYCADKLAELRLDATYAFRELSDHTVGDTSALAELIEACFSPSMPQQKRLEAERALLYELGTTWKKPGGAKFEGTMEVFPLSLLVQAKRGSWLGSGAR